MHKTVLWFYWSIAVIVVASLVGAIEYVHDPIIRISFAMGIVVGILIIPIAYVVAFAYLDWRKERKNEKVITS